jgi:hypothetical protein
MRVYSHNNLIWLLYHHHGVGGSWHRHKLRFSLKGLILILRDLIISRSWCSRAHWVGAKQHLIEGILFVTPIAVTSLVTMITICHSKSLFYSRTLQNCVSRLLPEEKIIKVKHPSIVNLWRILSRILNVDLIFKDFTETLLVVLRGWRILIRFGLLIRQGLLLLDICSEIEYIIDNIYRVACLEGVEVEFIFVRLNHWLLLVDSDYWVNLVLKSFWGRTVRKLICILRRQQIILLGSERWREEFY